MSTPVPLPIPPAPVHPGDSPLTRFPQAYASFQILGTLLRPPEYRRTTSNYPLAILTLATHPDRDLDVALFGMQGRHSQLKAQLNAFPVGALLLVHGEIQGPRTNRRENAQLVARQVIALPTNGTAAAHAAPAAPAAPATPPATGEAPGAPPEGASHA